MRLGCFGKIKDIDGAAAAGFDYIELDLFELISQPEERFQCVRRSLCDAQIGADACSWVMPIDADLTAPARQPSIWREYLIKGAERSRALGTVIWPLGSGRGRGMKPANGSEAQQKERFQAFFAELCEIAASYGIQVALEPLGPSYSNYIQTLEQAVLFLQGSGIQSAKASCDLRHMYASGDPLESIDRYAEYIIHTHIDYPLGDRRVFPLPDDGFDYTDYIRRIQKTKATRLSVEALQEPDLSVGRPSVTYLREMIKKVGK